MQIRNIYDAEPNASPDHAPRRFIPEPEPTSSRRHDILESLGQAICGGGLHEGDVLNMDELATRFKVSRPVVREACGVLSSLGLVVSRRRAGTVVQAPDQWELFSSDVIRWRLNSTSRASQIMELSELRSSIEPAAAELAARRATAAERERLVDCLQVLLAAGEAGDIPGFHRADKQFHTLIMVSGHNSMFAQLHRFVEGMLESRYRQGLMPDEIDPWALAWHSSLGRAVIEGDPAAARAAARKIVARSADEMIELSELPAPTPTGGVQAEGWLARG